MCAPCGYGSREVDCSQWPRSYAGQNDDLPAEHDAEGRL